MKSDIRFLQQLEGDLREAAARAASVPAEIDAAPSRTSSRPPFRRERRWGSVAAAMVALLVVAGSIGFLTQRTGSSNDSSSGAVIAASPTTVPQATARGAANVPTFSPAPAPGLTDASQPKDSANASGSGGGDRASSGSAAPRTDLSKIVRDGRIGIQLPNGTFSTSAAIVMRIAHSQGGVVLDAATQNETSGTFTLRIPARHFDAVIGRLRVLGTADGAQILYQEATGRDVTADFVDLQARLKISKGTKRRLVSLQAKTTSVSEILSLGNQIDQVQLQIEQIQGQLNLINDQVAESTVQVALRERDAATDPGSGVDNPSLSSAWDRSLQGFLRVLGAVIVGLGYLIPVALIAGGIWGVLTLVRRRRRATS
jgi:Domain of unknown function (DUF4349)